MTIRWSLVLALVLAVAQPADAAKWEGGCPKVKQKLNAVAKGPGGTAYAISRFYEHVGHDVTYYLRDNDVLRGGGFSTEPGGNTVQVTFTPIDGDPIPLPPIAVAATTPATLTFTMPDSRDYIGRLVVGPATVTVKRGDAPFFETRRGLVILPPMNDVQQLTQDGYHVDVYAAMDGKGRLWIPLDFNGYGHGGEQLPECPTPLTPVTPFAVEFSLKNGYGEALPYVTFGKAKKNVIYLGDYLVFGLNMYGNKLNTALRLSKSQRSEVILCGLNDALQLVIMIKLTEAAMSPNSELLEITRDGSPLVVKMENVSSAPDVATELAETTYDSALQSCYPDPVP